MLVIVDGSSYIVMYTVTILYGVLRSGGSLTVDEGSEWVCV